MKRAIADDGPKPKGRPRAEETSTTLTTWVPTHEYDRLVRLAQAREESLSAFVRQWLKKR